jgi:hypothetical protein
MQKMILIPLISILAVASVSGAPNPKLITTGTLLQEMIDMENLARWPQPAFRTIQFSSYDRRSTTSEAPDWFVNSDGFGREPVPNFEKVLRAPEEGRPGIYLVAEINGPGAIVRGWSAGMGGVLRVYMDPPAVGSGGGEGALVWEGPAYDFLARRSAHYIKTARVDLDAGNAFIQEDADYLPMPFARGLKVTWEGNINELHFYHLQVRLYPEGTKVRTFDLEKDLGEFQSQLRTVTEGLRQPAKAPGEPSKIEGSIKPGERWTWSPETKTPGAVRELILRLRAEQLDEALRGCLLRISFDGSQRPQVESPVGDFFGSGPGINPYSSVPFSVKPDGTMTCRFVMPYEKSMRLEIRNHTSQTVGLEGAVTLSDWQWDERSMYFRAKWRANHDLLAGDPVIDLPYLVAIGKGVFVGCAAIIMNPSGVPTANGNWWGEGDEKFFVDGEATPSTFGTGSEDYFNYSWSRSHLFSHPYCGQPLMSGPDTSGYLSNHRYQVTDAIPFETSFAAYMELLPHTRTPGLSYARIAYHYAQPNAIDDHIGLMPSDLIVPVLPKRELQALRGAKGARFFLPEQLDLRATAGRLETVDSPLATQLQVALWHAEKGGKLTFKLPVEKAGPVSITLIALHRPDGGSVRLLLNGEKVPVRGGADEARLHSPHSHRVLNVRFDVVKLEAGSHEVVLECTEAGPVGLDCVWVRID